MSYTIKKCVRNVNVHVGNSGQYKEVKSSKRVIFDGFEEFDFALVPTVYFVDDQQIKIGKTWCVTEVRTGRQINRRTDRTQILTCNRVDHELKGTTKEQLTNCLDMARRDTRS